MKRWNLRIYIVVETKYRDALIAEIAKRQKAIVVTNDGDYANYCSDSHAL